MKAKCYFCDTELELVQFTFRVGAKDEPVCESCNIKTVNRRKSSQS